MTFDTELQRQQDATAIATQIKEQVKTVAENKNIDIEYGVDDALSLLNKIDGGTITTPTDTLDITDNGIKDVTNYASVNVNVSGGTELPAFMSAKNFTFDGNTCTGYVGDNTLPEIIIPKSYSKITTTETVVGAKVLDKQTLSTLIYDFQSVTFSDGENNTQTYTTTNQLQNLSVDFPNDCYLVSMQGSNPFSFDFLQIAFDIQILQFPITINGQSFSDGMTAFDYIRDNNITNVNFGGDVEVTKFFDGNDYEVTSVGSANNQKFTSYTNKIILLDNITNINDDGFRFCNISSIIIPNSVTNIGRQAFGDGTELTEITLPKNITTVNEFTFGGCTKLSQIIIPSNVQSIQTGAFYLCTGLTDIIIPDNITIGPGAFHECIHLKNIIYSKTDNNTYNFKNGTLSIIGDVDDNPVWYEANINNLVIDVIFQKTDISNIGNNAFSGCMFQSFTVPDSVTTIGENAFNGCANLTTITLPNNPLFNTISPYIFAYSYSLTSISLPESIETIGDSAFRHCSSLTEITIPQNVTTIGRCAFEYCESLTEITIPQNVTTIEDYTFRGCKSLTSVIIPNSVTTIGESSFYGCDSLQTVTFESVSQVQSIEDYTFYSCDNLTSIILPDNVQTIGNRAFSLCKKLTNIIIPYSITNIDVFALYGCTNLTTVTIEATIPPTIQSTTFDDTVQTFYVPDTSVDAYKTATNWVNYAAKIQPLSSKGDTN